MPQSNQSAQFSDDAPQNQPAQLIGRRRFLQALGATAVGLALQPALPLVAARPIAPAFVGAVDPAAVRAVLAALDGRPATFFVTAADLRDQAVAGRPLWALVRQAGHELAFQATPHCAPAGYRADLAAWRAAWPSGCGPLPSPLFARAADVPCHALAAACAEADVLLTMWPPPHLPSWAALQQQAAVLLPLAMSGSAAEAALLALLRRLAAERRPMLTLTAYCARSAQAIEVWGV